MVDVQRFLKAFTREWQHDLTHAEQRLRQAFQNDTTWTDYMLNGKGAFLDRIAHRLQLSMAKELLRVDAIYHDPNANLLPDKGIYPNRLDMLIEHENQGDPEREMWKLLMLRAPLKVLIFYDWAEDEKRNNLDRQQWLTGKLSLLFRMGKAVDRQWPQPSKYLFLVGKRGQRDDILWHYWFIADGNWPDSPGIGTRLI